MTQQFEDFVNAALDKSLASDVTLPTANKIPVYTGIGRQVTAKTAAELDIAIKSDVDTALSSKEPTITAGTSAQYYRGDKTFQPLNTNAVTESTDKRYLSDAQKTIATQAASGGQAGYLSSADWNTFNNKQNALSDTITADTYGSSTQYPVITFNAKGIATGVTLQTVSVAEVSDSVFRVVDNSDATKKLAFEASGIGTGQTRTIIMPDVDVNLASYARAYQSTGLKTTTKQLYAVFPTGSTGQRHLTTDGSTPTFTPPESPFLFIPLPDDSNSSRPVLVNIKGIGYATDYPAVGTWVFQRRIIVGRGTEGVDAYGGVPLVQTVSDFSFGPFSGAIFQAFQKNNADIVDSQRVLCLTAEIPNNTGGSNLVVRVIAEIIYSEDTLPNTWL